jgi:hypothetical protein
LENANKNSKGFGTSVNSIFYYKKLGMLGARFKQLHYRHILHLAVFDEFLNEENEVIPFGKKTMLR